MRLTGVCIVNGFSSATQVFATHLQHASERLNPTVVCHEAPGAGNLIQTVRDVYGIPTVGVDTGYRQPSERRRDRWASKPPRWWLLRSRSSLLQQTIAATEPGVMYSSQDQIDCAASTRAAVALEVPQIIHLHYNVGPWLGKLPLARLTTCEHVIVISEFIGRQAVKLGVPPERVTTIHNTMPVGSPPSPEHRAEVRNELGIPLDARVVMQVSRMDPSKGFEDTVHAFSRGAATNPSAVLVLVGDGASRPLIEEMVRRAGLAGRVRLTGWRADVPRLLAAADVFAHPSINEPFGLAVMQASAAGLPVVAYADGAIPEIVLNGETGLLAPTGDRDALAQVVKTLLDDEETRQRFGAAGRARVVERFNPQVGGRRFSDVAEAVGRAGTRRP